MSDAPHWSTPEYRRQRRARNRAAGLCRCGRERDRSDRVHCAACRASACDVAERRRRGVRRAAVATVESERARTLAEVRRAWLDAPSVTAFAAWLKEQCDA